MEHQRLWAPRHDPDNCHRHCAGDEPAFRARDLHVDRRLRRAELCQRTGAGPGHSRSPLPCQGVPVSRSGRSCPAEGANAQALAAECTALLRALRPPPAPITVVHKTVAMRTEVSLPTRHRGVVRHPAARLRRLDFIGEYICTQCQPAPGACTLIQMPTAAAGMRHMIETTGRTSAIACNTLLEPTGQ